MVSSGSDSSSAGKRRSNAAKGKKTEDKKEAGKDAVKAKPAPGRGTKKNKISSSDSN